MEVQCTEPCGYQKVEGRIPGRLSELYKTDRSEEIFSGIGGDGHETDKDTAGR